DIQALRDHPAVERVDTRDDFRAELGGCDDFYRRFPDVLATAKEGYAFRGVSSGARPIYRMPRYEAAVPWYSPLEGAEKITDVAGMVLQAAQGQRVALILVEAVGCDTFPWPYRTIENCHHWHHYTAGDGQYLTLSSGRQFTEHPYPPGYRFYLEDHERKLYPFSGIYGQRPTGMLGQRFAGRSAAVGNRSVLTHLAAGAQITVECFARALYNQGVMAVCE
ncbi:MAG TPA: hypothetical protein PLG21_22805, partial [Anaerolineae bacterium]|nr:hypothetical protein [Anaerolineae bacterium]